MKVILRRVTKTPLDFDVKSNEITFKGYLQYHAGKLILLKANLQGEILTDCDVCAEEFKMPLDEKIEFFICDGIYKDEDSIELDVIESFDGEVEIEELLHSEIELIRSDYHSCDECKHSND
ncbi:hypothetical protein JHD46_01570 [Sulfurimonas sp. SAG-AH-194-C20]|nr:hypothetical protein [Sulfurimonas sp. SAG-AH-194-C20]MDF1878322.1 hypothetical protein [Sulfurimonas sp. SAG-AH-194-C20]